MDRVVRNFRLVEQIGTGGMGVIFRAIQTTLDRPVAFKELHPHLAKDAEFIRRFEREAKTAATLQHENIVGVIDFGKEGDNFFIAMEFVNGPDLKGLLGQEPRVVLPIAVTIALDALRGLDHAHGRGIVHRDIKPANIMTSLEGTVKIADFSIAQASTLPSMTMTGSMLGTPAYMSPEQVGGRPLDARTDLFSMAVILYEMLGGRRPFEGDTYATIISQLLTVIPPELSQLDPTVPEPIARVVRKGLEKDPDRRYPSAADFHRDLEQAAKDAKIPYGRQLLADYIKSPANFATALRQRQAKEAFQRGLYLMSQGKMHTNDAILALEQTLHLDPANDAAKKHLAELRGRRVPAANVASGSGRSNRGLFAGIAAVVMVVLVVGGVLGSGVLTPSAATPTPTATLAVVVPSVTTPPPATTVVVVTTPTPEPSAAPTETAVVVATPAPTRTKVAIVKTPTPPKKTPTPPPEDDGDLLADPEAAARGEGFLRISVGGVPFAKIYIDGKYIDDTPIAIPIKLKVGAHELKMTSPGFQDRVESIKIGPGKTTEKRFTLQK